MLFDEAIIGSPQVIGGEPSGDAGTPGSDDAAMSQPAGPMGPRGDDAAAAGRGQIEAITSLLREANVPLDRLDPGDIRHGAEVLAAEGGPPHAALTRSAVRDSLAQGHIGWPDVERICGGPDQQITPQQHFGMARLLRGRAAALPDGADTSALRSRANTFVSLAKVAAAQAGRPPAPATIDVPEGVYRRLGLPEGPFHVDDAALWTRASEQARPGGATGASPPERPPPDTASGQTRPSENGAPAGAVSDSGVPDGPGRGAAAAEAGAVASGGAAAMWPAAGDAALPEGAGEALIELVKKFGPRVLAALPPVALAALILPLMTVPAGGGTRSALMFDGRLRISVPQAQLFGTVETRNPDGNWQPVRDWRPLMASVAPDGTGSLDLKALRAALGDEAFGQLTGFPGDGGEPPEPLITRPPPLVPAAERLPVFDGLDLPSHTGAPPQVYDLGPFVTPVPQVDPDDWILKSVSGAEFRKSGRGWQGTSITHDQAMAKFKEEAPRIEQAWHAALAAVGYDRTPQGGTRVHTRAGENVEKLNIKNMRVEQSVAPDGTPGSARSKGTIRADLYQLKDDGTLMIYDFKAGNAVLTEARIRQIVAQAGRYGKVKNIVVLQVK